MNNGKWHRVKFVNKGKSTLTEAMNTKTGVIVKTTEVFDVTNWAGRIVDNRFSISQVFIPGEWWDIESGLFEQIPTITPPWVAD